MSGGCCRAPQPGSHADSEPRLPDPRARARPPQHAQGRTRPPLAHRPGPTPLLLTVSVCCTPDLGKGQPDLSSRACMFSSEQRLLTVVPRSPHCWTSLAQESQHQGVNRWGALSGLYSGICVPASHGSHAPGPVSPQASPLRLKRGRHLRFFSHVHDLSISKTYLQMATSASSPLPPFGSGHCSLGYLL